MESIGIGILSLMALITLAGGAALYGVKMRNRNKNWGKEQDEEKK